MERGAFNGPPPNMRPKNGTIMFFPSKVVCKIVIMATDDIWNNRDSAQAVDDVFRGKNDAAVLDFVPGPDVIAKRSTKLGTNI